MKRLAIPILLNPQNRTANPHVDTRPIPEYEDQTPVYPSVDVEDQTSWLVVSWERIKPCARKPIR